MRQQDRLPELTDRREIALCDALYSAMLRQEAECTGNLAELCAALNDCWSYHIQQSAAQASLEGFSRWLMRITPVCVARLASASRKDTVRLP